MKSLKPKAKVVVKDTSPMSGKYLISSINADGGVSESDGCNNLVVEQIALSPIDSRQQTVDSREEAVSKTDSVVWPFDLRN